MKVIRYSQAFKMQAVREVEAGQAWASAVQRKYGILGAGTVMRWVRQYGCGQYGKIIRVEKPDEIDEVARLRSQLRRAKEALVTNRTRRSFRPLSLQVVGGLASG